MVQQISISPTFYEQLFHTKVPKGQKDTDDLAVFLRFWGHGCVKVIHKHADEIDTRIFVVIGLFSLHSFVQLSHYIPP